MICDVQNTYYIALAVNRLFHKSKQTLNFKVCASCKQRKIYFYRLNRKQRQKR